MNTQEAQPDGLGNEIVATLESIGKARRSEDGSDRHWVLFRREGSKEKLWHLAEPRELQELRQGQKVSLLPSGEHKRWNIRVLEQPEDRIYQPLDEAMKARISAYVSDQADILRFCFQVAATNVQEEHVEKFAMALYIGAQRKFGL